MDNLGVEPGARAVRVRKGAEVDDLPRAYEDRIENVVCFSTFAAMTSLKRKISHLVLLSLGNRH